MLEGVAAGVLHAFVVSAFVSTLLFVIVSLVVRAVTIDAAARHALWITALCTTALMPFAVFSVAAVRGAGTGAVPALSSNAVETPSVHRAADPRTPPEALGGPPVPLAFTRAAQQLWRPRPTRIAALALAGIWFGGTVIGLGGLLRSVLRVRGLKRRSRPLDAELAAQLPWLTEHGRREREIYLRLCYEMETPVAVGFRRPVILIPVELANAGGLDAIEGLVMHEHAHLRRFDDWTNLIQRVIERVFWFNPIVWMFGRRIALEREIAADDAVVEATGRAAEYAQALWQLAREMRMPDHAVVAPGALFTRKQISIRIESLLDRHPVVAGSRGFAAGMVALTAVTCTVAAASTAPALVIPRTNFQSITPGKVAAHHDSPVLVKLVLRRAPSKASAPVPVVELLPAPLPTRSATAERTYRHRVMGSSDRELPGSLAPEQRLMAQLQAAAESTGAVAEATGAAAASAAARMVARCDRCSDPVPHRHSPAADRVDVAGADLSGRDLRGVDWRGQSIQGTNLSGADLRGARLEGARFVGDDLSNARLDGASLLSATISGTTIDGASLRNAKTTGMRVTGVSLSDLDLHNLDVRSIVSSCAGCDLTGTNLRGADLHGIVMNGTNLSNVDLTGANLRGSTLTGVNLESANLTAADLRDASFNGCSLQNASVRRADTRGTRFEETDIGDAV